MTDNTTEKTESSWPDAEPTEKQDNLPDAAIVPYVHALNDLNVETFQSCSGHVHPDGTRSDGTLWFDAPAVDVTALVECDVISHVKWMHKPEECWEIVFPGLAESERNLERAMKAVFRSVSADPPQEVLDRVDEDEARTGGQDDVDYDVELEVGVPKDEGMSIAEAVENARLNRGAGRFPENRFEEWKQEQIEAHRQSDHAYVVIEHDVDIYGGRFRYRVECGGYENTLPRWKSTDENVEIYDLQNDRYVDADTVQVETDGGHSVDGADRPTVHSHEWNVLRDGPKGPVLCHLCGGQDIRNLVPPNGATARELTATEVDPMASDDNKIKAAHDLVTALRNDGYSVGFDSNDVVDEFDDHTEIAKDRLDAEDLAAFFVVAHREGQTDYSSSVVLEDSMAYGVIQIEMLGAHFRTVLDTLPLNTSELINAMIDEAIAIDEIEEDGDRDAS